MEEKGIGKKDYMQNVPLFLLKAKAYIRNAAKFIFKASTALFR